MGQPKCGTIRSPSARNRATALVLAVTTIAGTGSSVKAQETMTSKMTGEVQEVRTASAVAATRRYFEVRAEGQHAEAYSMLAPDLAAQLSEDAFVARASEFAMKTGPVQGIEIRGTTWYDTDPPGGQPDSVAVDLRVFYDAPVLVCGYLVWFVPVTKADVEPLPSPVLRRKEIGVVEGAAIADMTEKELDEAYTRMGCR